MCKRGVAGEDRFSLLPDPLLCQILSNLPTKNAIWTSLLSKRCKSVWLSVPVLDLDISDFPSYNAFVSFVDEFIDRYRELCIHKLKLAFVRGQGDQSHMTAWIHNAVMRKVQHLNFSCRWSHLGLELMPLSLYTCQTLVCLKLHYVSLPDFEYASLPRLKIMHLEEIMYSSDAVLEKLISSSPVLEDLTVVRNVEVAFNVKALRVCSQSLNSLILVLSDEQKQNTRDREVLIDAPGLNYLSLEDYWSTSIVINNLSSSASVDIAVNFGMFSVSAVDVHVAKRSVVGKFLSGLSSVREMTISEKTLEIICHYMKVEPLPQFPYVTRFHANFNDSDLEKLPNFLESCPNLKTLVLELNEFNKSEGLCLSSSISECLRSSLEYVEMKTPITRAGAEMKLVEYLLENSVVLKKLTLRLDYMMFEASIILTELLRIRRHSASCEVVVEHEETYQTMKPRIF